ncbi:MAG: hypothetical protein Kow0077_12910 [Anaerolineae bacterium]
MFGTLESGIGLDIVVALQAGRTPALDALAQGMHFAGGLWFYLGLLTLMFWAVRRETGIHLLVGTLSATVITEFLKQLFQRPRPHIAHPEAVTALVTQGGYGLPSGHVLIALVTWGVLAWHLRSRWLAILAGLIVVVMGWARMYAGVHYPQDVVAGALVGGLVLAAYIRWQRPLSAWMTRQMLSVQIGVVLLLALAALVLCGLSETGYTLAGMIAGAGLGLLWEARRVQFSTHSEAARKMAAYLLGLALVGALYVGLSAAFAELHPESFFRVVRYTLLGLAVSAGWPALGRRLGLFARRKTV